MRNLIKKILKESDDLQWIKDVKVNPWDGIEFKVSAHKTLKTTYKILDYGDPKGVRVVWRDNDDWRNEWKYNHYTREEVEKYFNKGKWIMVEKSGHHYDFNENITESNDLQWLKDIEVDANLTPAQILMRFDEFPLSVIGPSLGAFLDLHWDGNKIILSVGDREELAELFVDNDSSQYGYVTKWLAEKVLAEDDWWEPYSDVVYDWMNQVWDAVTSNKELLNYIKEYIRENDFIGQELEYDEDPDMGGFREDMLLDDDLLGELIKDEDIFEDLKGELTWAYTSAYNIAAQDNIYKAIYSELDDVFGKSEWKSIDTGSGTKHFLQFDVTNIVMETLLEELEDCIGGCKRYFDPDNERHFNPDEHGSELEAFEEYCEECRDYPFTDYAHFLSFYRDYLDERDELFNPRFDEYPDDSKVYPYFVDDVYGRI